MIDRLMVDTNTVSYILRGKSPAARARLESLSKGEKACISAITEAELLYGMAKSQGSSRANAATKLFLSNIEVLPWGRDESAEYGKLRATLQVAGKMLGSMDLLIAAHAIAAGAVLVSSDKAFAQVERLVTVNWATDL